MFHITETITQKKNQEIKVMNSVVRQIESSPDKLLGQQQTKARTVPQRRKKRSGGDLHLFGVWCRTVARSEPIGGKKEKATATHDISFQLNIELTSDP